MYLNLTDVKFFIVRSKSEFKSSLMYCEINLILEENEAVPNILIQKLILSVE
jgi:hypothetical protein